MTARTIYALTAGHKPVVVTNHFYMRPDIRDSLYTQFFFWCIMDEKEGPILVDQSFTQQCLDEMNITHTVKEHPLEMLARIGVKPGMSSSPTCTGITTPGILSIPMPDTMFTKKK